MTHGENLVPALQMPEAVEIRPKDDGYYLDTFGLGPAETSITLEYDGHSGAVADMLTDEECPVGRQLARAYEEGGIKKVQTKLGSLTEFFDAPEIPVSEQTLSYHAKKLTRKELLESTEERAESPDFLA